MAIYGPLSFQLKVLIWCHIWKKKANLTANERSLGIQLFVGAALMRLESIGFVPVLRTW